MRATTDATVNVLFATDGSNSAEQARELVASIDWPAPTNIEVLHVDQLVTQDLQVPAGGYSAAHDKLRDELISEIDGVRASLSKSGRMVKTNVVINRPATGILAEARRTNADLIVMGSHGRGTLASAVLGSVSAEVVDHAPCPVLIARTPRITRIVLAHDGSDGARQAEEVITMWQFLQRLPVRVVSAWSLAPSYVSLDAMGGGFMSGDLYQQVIDDIREERTRNASEAAKRLAENGVQATAEVGEGPTAQTVISAAKEFGAELIVVGSRGQTGLPRILLGSVARSVLFNAPCSVLITRQRTDR
jgi:nucleotide-binding universal stress UspA family protein